VGVVSQVDFPSLRTDHAGLVNLNLCAVIFRTMPRGMRDMRVAVSALIVVLIKKPLITN
jgi:hypothetical protein